MYKCPKCGIEMKIVKEASEEKTEKKQNQFMDFMQRAYDNMNKNTSNEQKKKENDFYKIFQ